jgi:hypothetical protein
MRRQLQTPAYEIERLFAVGVLGLVGDNRRDFVACEWNA